MGMAVATSRVCSRIQVLWLVCWLRAPREQLRVLLPGLGVARGRIRGERCCSLGVCMSWQRGQLGGLGTRRVGLLSGRVLLPESAFLVSLGIRGPVLIAAPL
jgi:hypothetical protein